MRFLWVLLDLSLYFFVIAMVFLAFSRPPPAGGKGSKTKERANNNKGTNKGNQGNTKATPMDKQDYRMWPRHPRNKVRKWKTLARHAYEGRNLLTQAMYLGRLRYWIPAVHMPNEIITEIYATEGIVDGAVFI